MELTPNLVVFAALAICHANALATDLKIASQNTLHLSKNSKTDKLDYIKKQDGNYGVTVLQEVMSTANLSNVQPGSYLFKVSGVKGHSSYKEAYGFIYSSTLTVGALVDYGGTEFSRAPSGVPITVGTSNIWFIDFHAIFGKSVGLRRAEAKAMATVYNVFSCHPAAFPCTTPNPVVMGGDWNLPTTDWGFDDLKALSTDMRLSPNVDSSLTRAGDPSEPYDHFVTDGTKVNMNSCGLIGFLDSRDGKWFRSNVSDHRGIECTITY